MVFMPGAAFAISDEANPWLALESAACAAHVITDYAAETGASVSLTSAEWNGASTSLPTHCHVTGTLNGMAVDVRLPTVWNGQVYAPCAAEHQSPIDALNAGVAVAFTAPTPDTFALLKVMALHHYPEAQTMDFAASKLCQ